MALEMPAAAVPSVELEVATRPEDLEFLRAEWSALLLRCPAATPFQSPEWLIPWWRRFGSGRLLVLVLRRSRACLQCPVSSSSVFPFREDSRLTSLKNRLFSP